VCVFVFVLHKM